MKPIPLSLAVLVLLLPCAAQEDMSSRPIDSLSAAVSHLAMEIRRGASRTNRKIALTNARLASDSAARQRVHEELLGQMTQLRENSCGVRTTIDGQGKKTDQELARIASLLTAQAEQTRLFALLTGVAFLLAFIAACAAAVVTCRFRACSPPLPSCPEQPQDAPEEPELDAPEQNAHVLACTLAREILRTRTRLNGTGDQSTMKALDRLEAELNSLGYCFRDLRDQPYSAGMAVSVANFLSTPELKPGAARIHRTIRPEIAYRGTIIDPGVVEVLVGEDTSLPKEVAHGRPDHRLRH